MIIYTVFDNKKKKQFVMVFEIPYFANLYRDKVEHSTRFKILRVIHDYV